MLRGLCHIQNWHTIKNLAGKAFLDSSSLVWSQPDSSSSISHNCCCQCWRPAAAPSLSISCPALSVPHCAEISPSPAGLPALCSTGDKHTWWAIKPIIWFPWCCVLLSQAVAGVKRVSPAPPCSADTGSARCGTAFPISLEGCYILAVKCHKWGVKISEGCFECQGSTLQSQYWNGEGISTCKFLAGRMNENLGSLSVDRSTPLAAHSGAHRLLLRPLF